mgnify:CR=1 FL=1
MQFELGADAGTLAPFTYVSMLWALVIGYVVFAEVPTVPMLAGAARILARRAGNLKGEVRFMFQPGEEGVEGRGSRVERSGMRVAGCGGPRSEDGSAIE